MHTGHGYCGMRLRTGAGTGYSTKLGKANTLVQHFLESCDGIPKYCITRVQDSMTLPYKKQWLEMHYPGQFLDVIGTATPERKTSVVNNPA